jgi:hypothetical protein
VIGHDIKLEIQPHAVGGRFGGGILGKDVNLNISHNNILGRFGGVLEGESIQLETTAPPEIKALAAALAFAVLEHQNKK